MWCGVRCGEVEAEVEAEVEVEIVYLKVHIISAVPFPITLLEN